MFILPKLEYAFDALEPYIDARTMELHYTKHHQTYLDNLNAALKDYPELQKLSIEEILTQLPQLPEKIRQTIQDNGGGFLLRDISTGKDVGRVHIANGIVNNDGLRDYDVDLPD